MNEYITHSFPFLFLGILPTVLFAVRGVMDLIVPQSELFLKTVENLLPLVRFFYFCYCSNSAMVAATAVCLAVGKLALI